LADFLLTARSKRFAVVGGDADRRQVS